jgi:phospholipid-binding lipoprotein MlaA
VAAGLVGGCASGDTGAAEVWDPIETPNRFMFAINRTVDMIAVRPLAVMYRDGVPEGAQKSVRNLLDNLGEPVTAINEVFQGDPSRAATTMARFLVNSTLGVAGLFDVATMLGMKRTKTDAGQTIGIWAGKGVEPENGGFYLVLPLAGPSNARDATGLMIDYAIDPFQILPIALNVDWFYYSAPRYALTVVDYRSRTMFALDDLEKNSVDYYAALRSPTPRTVPNSFARSVKRPTPRANSSVATTSRWYAKTPPSEPFWKERTVLLLACRRVVLASPRLLPPRSSPCLRRPPIRPS